MGRATEGKDFVPLRDSIVFLANQSEANITLRVLDDEDPERDEAVFVKLISVQLSKGEQERLSKILTLPLRGRFYLKKIIEDIMILQPYYTKLMKSPFTVPYSFQFPFSGPQD